MKSKEKTVVTIEIKYEQREDDSGIATYLTGMPTEIEGMADEMADDNFMAELTPEQQFGLLAMNAIEQYRDFISLKMRDYSAIRKAKLQ